MQVTINLYGELKAYIPEGQKPVFVLKVPLKTTVREVLHYLKVPSDLPVAVVVNGTHREKDHRVANDDVLSVFSMAAFKDTAAR